jgi:inner membrane protein
VDPICHTLTGAALGFTGLEKRARFGRATLIIGANLPDLDAVTYLIDGMESLAIRRGVTHGIPALMALPLLLAMVMKGLAALSTGPPAKQDATFRQLWLLAAISMATHPVLDFLNNYGMRWLMPFVDRWVYGDTLYIIDPILWGILLTGVVLAAAIRSDRPRWWRNPATIALTFAGVYILLNAGGTLLARRALFAALPDDPPQRLMASPVLLRPLQRRLVLEYPHEYRIGAIDLLPRMAVDIEPRRIPKGDPRDLLRAATTREGAAFLQWARFPLSESEIVDGELVVRAMDARYAHEWQGGFGVISVTLTPHQEPQ